GVGPGEDGVELGEFGGGAVVGGGGVDAAGEVGVDAEAQGLFGAVKDEQRVADHEVEQGSAELVGSGDGHGGLDAGDVFVGDEADGAAGEAGQSGELHGLAAAHLGLDEGERIGRGGHGLHGLAGHADLGGV